MSEITSSIVPEKSIARTGFFRSLATLYCLTSLPILGLIAYGQTTKSGLGPYLEEVERAFRNDGSIVVYVAVIFAYSVFWEFIIREGIQARLLRNPGKHFVFGSIFAPAAIYSLIHARYGLPQCVIAFGVGTICALFYNRTRNWKLLAAWHLAWDSVAMVAGAIINRIS